MAKYIESLCEQTKMDRSSLHNWLYIGEKKDVFRAVKDMSLRQFISFSRGEAPAAPEEPAVRVKDNQVYIGDRSAVTLDEGLDPKTRAYFEGVIIEAGEVLYTTRLYDREELRRFERATEKLKQELRVNYKGKRR
jgi:hypothetical protein